MEDLYALSGGQGRYLYSCDLYLVGGADKVIRLWEVNSKLCVLEYRGHRDVVRDVKVASLDTFYSAANDW